MTERLFPYFADSGGYTTQFILFPAGSRFGKRHNAVLFQGGPAVDLRLR
jgi:hypothetical protein